MAPWWRDCTGLTEREVLEGIAHQAENWPATSSKQWHAAQALGLDLPSTDGVIARLREVVKSAGPEFDLISAEDGEPYDQYFQL